MRGSAAILLLAFVAACAPVRGPVDRVRPDVAVMVPPAPGPADVPTWLPPRLM